MTYTRITDYLDETASRLPDKAAYVDSNRAITFREIRDEAYKLAGGSG